MELNDLLIREGIEPKDVLVMRHRPHEPEVRKVLPWLAAEKPDIYNAYQRSQSPRVESALKKATFLVSFIGQESGKALFVGLYQRGNWEALTNAQYWEVPANRELGEYGLHGVGPDRETTLWFDLKLTEFYSQWKGKLVVNWPGLERSWWRWANRNNFVIDVVHEQSLLDENMPPWNELYLTWEDLRILPSKWKAAIAEWRGIYFIFDESDGKGYVGSAYGTDNILGRWLNYAATGHGGNRQLRERDPKSFRFSILQRLSPDMDADDVIRIEGTWKERLHTRDHGLNEN